MIVGVEDLSHSYGSRTALQSVSFGVHSGEIFGVLGPNGSGKSTLFRILATMLNPSAGTLTVDGISVLKEPAKVRRRIGVVFQSSCLDKLLTVEENLYAQGHLYGLSGALLRERVEESLGRLGLGDRRDDRIKTLSGGLRRRAEIARALLHHPPVLLLDEPSTGIDPAARRELWRYLDDLRTQAGVTVLLTTHLMDEAETCDRLLLLHNGSVVAEGPPAELKQRIGGDVIVLKVKDTAEAAERIRERFPLEPRVADGTIRVETGSGHRLVAELFETLPGRIESVTIHKPTLEDVFLNETGAAFDD